MSSLPRDPFVLLEQVKQGSEQAFDRFYQEYFPFVFRLALKLTKNPYEAEDVCHDILLDFFQRPHLFDPQRGSFESFLAVKTKNKCLDLLRKQQRIAFQEVQETDLMNDKQEKQGQHVSMNPTMHYVLMQEKRQMVHEALERIPTPQRLALYGAYIEERSQRVLAEQLKKPLGTIKSLIRYGLKNMKKHLGPYNDPQAGGDRHGKC